MSIFVTKVAILHAHLGVATLVTNLVLQSGYMPCLWTKWFMEAATPSDEYHAFEESIRHAASQIYLYCADPQRVWQALIETDMEVPSFAVRMFDPLEWMNAFLDVSLEDIVLVARSFYLWSLSDIICEIPILEPLQPKLNEVIKKYGCDEALVRIPIDVSDTLHPITGNLGKFGGQQALNTLIGEYAARLPTREEMIPRYKST